MANAPSYLTTRSVRVSWQDIRDGQPIRPDRCPLALALNREFGGRWIVGPRDAIRYDFHDLDGMEYRHDGQSFVTAFDMFRWGSWLWPRTIRLTPKESL